MDEGRTLSDEDELALPDELLEQQKERSYTRLRRRSLGPVGPQSEPRAVTEKGRKKRRTAGSRKVKEREDGRIGKGSGREILASKHPDIKAPVPRLRVIDADDEELVDVRKGTNANGADVEVDDDFLVGDDEEIGESDDEANLLRHLTSQNGVVADDDQSNSEERDSDEDTEGGAQEDEEGSREGYAQVYEEDMHEGAGGGASGGRDNTGREKLQFQTQKIIRDTTTSFTPKLCSSNISLSSILHEPQSQDAGQVLKLFKAQEKLWPVRACQIVNATKTVGPSVDLAKIQELVHGGLSSDSEADFFVEGEDSEDDEDEHDHEKGQFQLAKFRIEEQRVLQERGVGKHDFHQSLSIHTDHFSKHFLRGKEKDNARATGKLTKGLVDNLDPLVSPGNNGMRNPLQRKSSFRTFTSGSGGLRGTDRNSRGRSFVFSGANIEGGDDPICTTKNHEEFIQVLSANAQHESVAEYVGGSNGIDASPAVESKLDNTTRRIYRSVSRSMRV